MTILAGVAWYGFLRQGSNPLQQAQNQPAPIAPKLAQNTPPTPSPAEKWQTVTWHDPANAILGYKLDIPDNWVELSQNSERSIEVANCQPNTPGRDYASLNITAASASETMGFVDDFIFVKQSQNKK